MKSVKLIIEEAKKYSIKYPAVLSGIFIYGYLLFCIFHYYIRLKSSPALSPVSVELLLDSFDAFPFLWLLSYVLVKVIDIRTKLHESEQQRLQSERELVLQQTKLATLREVTRGIQHHINNPLSIIMLTLGSAHKAAADYPVIDKKLKSIDNEINRIIAALADFSKAESYETDSVDSRVGKVPIRTL